MAVAARYVKQLPSGNRRWISVDTWFYKNVEKVINIREKREMVVSYNESDSWKMGLDVHGLNKLSSDRDVMLPKAVAPFGRTNIVLANIVIPEDVRSKLHSSRHLTTNNKRVYHPSLPS